MVVELAKMVQGFCSAISRTITKKITKSLVSGLVLRYNNNTISKERPMKPINMHVVVIVI